MKTILFDTSIWIDALRGDISPQTSLLQSQASKRNGIALCPIIIQEVLQGIRDDKQFETVKINFSGFHLLTLDPWKVAVGAAELYRDLRKFGVTIRKSNDCSIAYYAIHFGIPMVYKDRDFDLIVKHSRLKGSNPK